MRADRLITLLDRSSFLPVIVLRLILGLAALGMLHSVLFAPTPLSARERARRDRR